MPNLPFRPDTYTDSPRAPMLADRPQGTPDMSDSWKVPNCHYGPNRPQSEAKPEVTPNPQEIPATGKDLKADPGPVSRVIGGVALANEKKPFKF